MVKRLLGILGIGIECFVFYVLIVWLHEKTPQVMDTATEWMFLIALTIVGMALCFLGLHGDA